MQIGAMTHCGHGTQVINFNNLKLLLTMVACTRTIRTIYK